MQSEGSLKRCASVVALALLVRNAITIFDHNAFAVVFQAPRRNAAAIIYPFPTADHNDAYALSDHALKRARELDATVVRVGRVSTAARWLAHTAPASLRHVSLGGHGNGTRVMWGDGVCHATDRECGLWPSNAAFLALLRSRLTDRAVVVLESCYALSMAPAIAAALRQGARVFATDACYTPDMLRYVVDASGDLVPMIFDPWHASTTMNVFVAPDCVDLPWVTPDWLRTLGVTGCEDVTMDVCLSDDAG